MLQTFILLTFIFLRVWFGFQKSGLFHFAHSDLVSLNPVNELKRPKINSMNSIHYFHVIFELKIIVRLVFVKISSVFGKMKYFILFSLVLNLVAEYSTDFDVSKELRYEEYEQIILRYKKSIRSRRKRQCKVSEK